jgi:transposase-like protein
VPRTYDPEFRRRVLELVRDGRPVRVVAAELGLAEATVYRWKAQDLIDRGVKPGTSTSEHGELAVAKRRIKELETELALVKQAAKLFEEGVRPKATYPVIAELASQGFSAKRCCRIPTEDSVRLVGYAVREQHQQGARGQPPFTPWVTGVRNGR